VALVAAACGQSSRSSSTADPAGGSSANAGRGGSSAAGTSGGGASTNAGSGPTGAVPVACTAGATLPASYRRSSKSDVREATTGENGTLTDSCDTDGNLLQTFCDGASESVGDGSDPGATVYRANGKVVTETVDCGGRCVDGVCPDSCPKQGDSLRYASVSSDGSATLDDETSGWSYDCQLNFDSSAACKGGVTVGDVVQVSSGMAMACPHLAAFTTGTETVCRYQECVPTPP